MMQATSIITSNIQNFLLFNFITSIIKWKLTIHASPLERGWRCVTLVYNDFK